SGGGPAGGVGEFLGAAEHDADGGAAGAGQLGGGDRLGGERALGAEPAADVLGDDVHLGGVELPAFGRVRGDGGHGLGGQVQVEVALVVPAGHAGVRLQRRVDLDGGGVRARDEAGVGPLPGLVDALGGGAAAPARPGERAAHVAVPLAGQVEPLAGRGGVLPALLVEVDGRGVGRVVERGGQRLVPDPGGRGGGERVTAGGRGHGGDRLAGVADGPVGGQQVHGGAGRLGLADAGVR